jgi:hypothetical protein
MTGAEEGANVSEDGTPFGALPADIQQASKDCISIAGAVEEQLEGLKSYVESLGNYTGVTADDWRALMDSVHGDALNLHSALVGIGDGLQGTYDAYTEAEVLSDQQIEHIAAELPPLNL